MGENFQFTTRIIGAFSIVTNDPNNGGEFELDSRRNCRYLHEDYADDKMHVNFNLKQSMDSTDGQSVSKQIDQFQRIDYLLEYILSDKSCLAQTDFVCTRRLLQKLMSAPYDIHLKEKPEFDILTMKFEGKIYLCEKILLDDKSKRWGLNFERYILTDDRSRRPSVDAPFHEWGAFRCMFQSTMNGHRVLYSADMDGIESGDRDNDLNECKFIELKTKFNKRGYKPFELCRWWCQCYLANIKKIILGGMNESCVVKKLTHFDVDEIQLRAHLQPSVCMKSCSDFLQLVSEKLAGIDSPSTVYLFKYEAGTEVPDPIIYEGENEFRFLPNRYAEQMRPAV